MSTGAHTGRRRGSPKIKLIQSLRQQIKDQQAWIQQCGQTVSGYILRYGSPESFDCFGNGGRAIYEADQAHLTRLRKRLAALEGSRG